mgnify:CR=1 FL=1
MVWIHRIEHEAGIIDIEVLDFPLINVNFHVPIKSIVLVFAVLYYDEHHANV